MAPTTGSESNTRIEMAHPRRRSSTSEIERRAFVGGNNPASALAIVTDVPEKLDRGHARDFDDDDDDRDDKSWRTRGESSPSLASAIASPARLLGASLSRQPCSWEDAVDASESADVAASDGTRRKRQLFWRNIMRQYNFVDQEDERALVLSLTDGIDWTTMELLPRKFMARHKEVYYLICRGDYERSSMIQRDVTRTFSIFERSQLPRRARDVDEQQRALFRVLNAVAEAEDGYCQGMNFIAGLFLVEGLDEADAYALFLYLLRKRQLARIYHHSSTFLDDYLVHFERMFKSELPDLYAHMHAQGFALPMYGIEWFTTLFSLSTKPDLACAIFDLFFVGVQDIFLRMGLAVLKLLEAPLMCMSFEDFLRDFKPLVRQLDPYHAVLKALAFRPNALVARGEDTTAHIARLHYMRAAAQGNTVTTPSGDTIVQAPRAFLRHRSLPPEMADAIARGDVAQAASLWLLMTAQRERPLHWLVLANEMLHFAVWHGQVAVARFAIRECGADVDNADDTALTPLHFAVIRDQPDLVRALLCCGADPRVRGGRWSGTDEGLTPRETALHWKFRDTTAARLVLEREVCLCCNAKFDAFAFHRETCRKCKFPFCGRGTDPCIARHQCPDVYRRWRQRLRTRGMPPRTSQDVYDEDDTDTGAVGSDTVELAGESIGAAASDAAGSAPSSASSRRSSRSTSEASSSHSFVLINAPACDLPTDRTLGDKVSSTATDRGIQSTTDTQGSAGLLGSLVGWLSGGASELPRDDESDEALIRATLGRGIDFPDRPAWYCNDPRCHGVFAFFSRGDECSRCGGLFCAIDFDFRSRQCRRCQVTQ